MSETDVLHVELQAMRGDVSEIKARLREREERMAMERFNRVKPREG